jgi:hypothetical protein
MALSREWTEYHLTPRGWEAGTEKTDFARTDRPAPSDRVVTERWVEEMPSSYSSMNVHTELVWESDDQQTVTVLRSQFGPSPSSL